MPERRRSSMRRSPRRCGSGPTRSLPPSSSSARLLVLGRPSALAAAGDVLDGAATIALPEDEPPHPVRDLAHASRALDRARGALERAVAARYRERSDAWLIIDGALSESPSWAEDPRLIGVAKSHATLPFDGEELERYLHLPYGHRSSLFTPASRGVAPVRAWALRLWPRDGRDLFHGLIRVEVAPVNGTSATAEWISRRLLAERAPRQHPGSPLGPAALRHPLGGDVPPRGCRGVDLANCAVSLSSNRSDIPSCTRSSRRSDAS